MARVEIKTPPDFCTGARVKILNRLDFNRAVCQQIHDAKLHQTRHHGLWRLLEQKAELGSGTVVRVTPTVGYDKRAKKTRFVPEGQGANELAVKRPCRWAYAGARPRRPPVGLAS